MKIYKNENMFAPDSLDVYSAYMLGFFVADGSVNANGQFSIYLHDRDEEIIQKMVDIIFDNGSQYVLHTTNNRVGFCMNNKTITRDLTLYGIVPNKTHKEIQWPTMDASFYIHFLRGLIDGDGSVGTGSYVQLLGSRSLLEGAAKFVSNLIGCSAVVRKRTDANLHVVKWYKGSRDLMVLLYHNAPIALRRKSEKTVEIMEILDANLSHQGSIRCNALQTQDVINRYRDKVKIFVDSHSRIPTYNEFRKLGSLSTVYKHFGSFNKMMSILGYQPRLAVKVKV